MKQKEVEQRVRNAMEHAAPDKADEILNACSGRPEASEAPLPERKKKSSHIMRICAAAAAAVIVFVSVWLIAGYRTTRTVDSIVMLDVNPSFSLSVNAKETVLAVEALNEDARSVLGDMELSGVSLEVAINALIGSMLQNGYLDELQNSILVSVENDDANRSEQLRAKVASAINSCMSGDQLEGAVLSQTVSGSDDALKALAEQYGISLGKAALIQEVLSQDATLTFADLAGLSVNEIALISNSKQQTSGEISVSQTGTVSTKAYIGRDEALAAACAHAGVQTEDLLQTEVEFDSENGVMVYEVEFRVGNTEYEYDIDAKTGEILKQKIEDNTPGHDPSTHPGGPSGDQSFIGETAAQEAALKHAGYSASDAAYIRSSVEYDDGRAEYYEVEFRVGNTAYEYKIDLYSGAVLAHETETRPQSSAGATTSPSATPTPAPATPTPAPSAPYIGEEAAKAAAFAHAGVDASSVVKLEIEFDFDDDHGPVYEIEFHSGRMEFDYEIDARTGAILKSESDFDD